MSAAGEPPLQRLARASRAKTPRAVIRCKSCLVMSQEPRALMAEMTAEPKAVNNDVLAADS